MCVHRANIIEWRLVDIPSILDPGRKRELCKLLALNLPTLRAKAGLSQDELADRLGFSRQTLSAIEGKKREMQWSTYSALYLFFARSTEIKQLMKALRIIDTDVEANFTIDIDVHMKAEIKSLENQERKKALLELIDKKLKVYSDEAAKSSTVDLTNKNLMGKKRGITMFNPFKKKKPDSDNTVVHDGVSIKLNDPVDIGKNNEEVDIVELFDETGDSMLLEILATASYLGDKYFITTVYLENAPEDEHKVTADVFVLKEVFMNNDSMLEPVSDMTLVDKIFGAFRKAAGDKFDYK